MVFLNHREEGMVLYQVFLPSPYCTRLREFERNINFKQSCRGDCD
jgi:hypothetical protein